eukprot:12021422-Ditylum_brightwellii.AAC.1
MLLERTAKLEAQSSSSTSKEILQMKENTKLLEKKQKEYNNWKEAISKELGKLNSWLLSMSSITKNMAANQDIKNMARNKNNVIME